MQPTNSEVDYEKVLQIYFHYDMERVHQDSRVVYEASKFTDSYRAACMVHKFVNEMHMDGFTWDDEHRYGMGGPYNPIDAAESIKAAWRLQEFINDWHEAMKDVENDYDISKVAPILAAISVVVDNMRESVEDRIESKSGNVIKLRKTQSGPSIDWSNI